MRSKSIFEGLRIGAIGAALVVTLMMLLGTTVEICQCEADPDGCGEACHVCVDETDCAPSAVLLPECACDHPEAPHLAERSDHCRHETIRLNNQLLNVQFRCPAVVSVALPFEGFVDFSCVYRSVCHISRFHPPDIGLGPEAPVVFTRIHLRS